MFLSIPSKGPCHGREPPVVVKACGKLLGIRALKHQEQISCVTTETIGNRCHFGVGDVSSVGVVVEEHGKMAAEAHESLQPVHERPHPNVALLGHGREVTCVRPPHRVEVLLRLHRGQQLAVRRLHHVHLQVHVQVLQEEEHLPVQHLQGAHPDVVAGLHAAIAGLHQLRENQLELHARSFCLPKQCEELVVLRGGVLREHEMQRPLHRVLRLELIPRRRRVQEALYHRAPLQRGRGATSHGRQRRGQGGRL
mmetsp:Transcript_17740/g.32514  ORF Transcript_17740/g.32514 Transcript_17740/m.32514 type:complete len:252 (-) Transcript_17740:444-1199(-)